MRFPTYTTKDLNGSKLTLPDDFVGEVNLLFVAYERWQQASVDSWVGFAAEMEAGHPGLRYYELPVVGEANLPGRVMLDYWMRQGIPDIETRGRTLTLYVEQSQFCESLDIVDRDQIAILLLDANGDVIWRSRGPFATDTAERLEIAVNEALPAGSNA